MKSASRNSLLHIPSTTFSNPTTFFVGLEHLTPLALTIKHEATTAVTDLERVFHVVRGEEGKQALAMRQALMSHKREPTSWGFNRLLNDTVGGPNHP